MRKVIIVTVTYNTGKDTEILLNSIEKLTNKSYKLETVIIDNASKVKFEIPKNLKTKTFLKRLNENLGFTGGYNAGIYLALEKNADYILVVNNDTILDPLLIENLLSAFTLNKRVGVTTPKIYFAKGKEFHKDRYTNDQLGKVFWYAGGYMDWENAVSVHRGVDEVDSGQYDITQKTDFASGCCMLIKRKVIEDIGFFDDKYFLYFEDADFNMRIKKKYDVVYAPKAVLYHVNASSTGGAGNILQDYYITRNRMLFGFIYAPLRLRAALARESIRILLKGRKWQKKGIVDFYLGKFGKGSFKNE